MSKSTGNFWSIKDGLEKYDPQLIRMFFCQTQWQQVSELNDDKIEQARSALQRIQNFLQTSEVKLKTSISQLLKEKSLNKKLLRQPKVLQQALQTTSIFQHHLFTSTSSLMSTTLQRIRFSIHLQSPQHVLSVASWKF
jgi:cysteinyl-tRNA synthetase